MGICWPLLKGMASDRMFSATSNAPMTDAKMVQNQMSHRNGTTHQRMVTALWLIILQSQPAEALDSLQLAIAGTIEKKPVLARLTGYYVENPSLLISVLFLDWWNGVIPPFIQRVAF